MNNLITDVGIDMDGVLYPFATAFKEYCAERMGRLFLPDPTHWNFYEDWDLDKNTFEQWVIDAAQTHDVFFTQEPYEGALAAWEDLKNMGLRIHVLTARPFEAWAQTAEWLEKHGFKPDTLHFSPSKAFFAKLARGKAIMVDDHVAYYEEALLNGVIPVLLDRPWNRDKENATRVQDLPSFVSIIRGFNMSAKTANRQAKKENSLKDWRSPRIPSQFDPHELKYKWLTQRGINGIFQSQNPD